MPVVAAVEVFVEHRGLIGLRFLGVSLPFRLSLYRRQRWPRIVRELEKNDTCIKKLESKKTRGTLHDIEVLILGNNLITKKKIGA